MATKVSVFLKSLDIEIVGPGVECPVEILEIVAWHILAVVCKLDGDPVVGTSVQAAKESLHNQLGHERREIGIGVIVSFTSELCSSLFSRWSASSVSSSRLNASRVFLGSRESCVCFRLRGLRTRSS